jgi:hypothetical protein
MLSMDMVLIYSTFMFSVGQTHALKKFHIHIYKEVSSIKFFYFNKFLINIMKIFVINYVFVKME